MMSVLRNVILKTNTPPKKSQTSKQTKATTLLRFNILIMFILYEYVKDTIRYFFNVDISG